MRPALAQERLRGCSQDRITPAVWVVLAAAAIAVLPKEIIWLPPLLIAYVAVGELERTIRYSARPPVRMPRFWMCLGVLMAVVGWAVGFGVIASRLGHPGIALVIACTFAADTAALYGGRMIGRHKLARRISPGKTWEGLGCGLLAGMAVVALIRVCFLTNLSWLRILVAAAILVVCGVAGDLTESAFKRWIGIKDTGTLLRGMGGLLDRIDALIFATLTAWILIAIGWL